MQKIIVDGAFTLTLDDGKSRFFGPGETVPRDLAEHWYVQAQIPAGKAHEDRAEYDEDVAAAKAAKEADAEAAARDKAEKAAAVQAQKDKDAEAAKAEAGRKAAEDAELKALLDQEAKEKAEAEASAQRSSTTTRGVRSQG